MACFGRGSFDGFFFLRVLFDGFCSTGFFCTGFVRRVFFDGVSTTGFVRRRLATGSSEGVCSTGLDGQHFLHGVRSTAFSIGI